MKMSRISKTTKVKLLRPLHRPLSLHSPGCLNTGNYYFFAHSPRQGRSIAQLNIWYLVDLSTLAVL